MHIWGKFRLYKLTNIFFSIEKISLCGKIYSTKGDFEMSVNKYKAIEYYLKKHNKVENGVYTENILCGNLDMITPSMITSANKKAKELGAKKVNIRLCNALEKVCLKKKKYPEAEGVIAIRLKGKVFENIEKETIAYFAERYDGKGVTLPRRTGKEQDVVLLASEDGVKAVEVNEETEQIAENSKDTTTKHILEENYNSIEKDEDFINFCNSDKQEQSR